MRAKKFGKPANLKENSNASAKSTKKFIIEPNRGGEFKQKANKIFYEENSGRTVGRIIGINKSTVYNWIKKSDEKIQTQTEQKKRPLMNLNR